jgi:hypothetical protein
VALLLHLSDLAGWLTATLLLAYTALIIVVATTAVFARRSAQRRAAMQVLRLLWPRPAPRRPPEDGSGR